jgi:electron transfer flavoprotein-quinone oxidoreductase
MEKFEVIIVGAGLAGLSAAYALAQEGVEVVVIERGDYPGAKNVTGGRLYTRPLQNFLPELWIEAPFERPVTNEIVTLFSPDKSLTLRFRSDEFARPPAHSYTVLRGTLDRWLAKKAEEKGAMLVSKNRVDDLLKKDGKVVGVLAGGEELGADVVIACDGALSLISEKAGLKSPGASHDYAVGFKEVIELPSQTIEDRLGLKGQEGSAQLFLGDLTKGRFGGGFLYTNRSSLSLGLVIRIKDLAEGNPLREAPQFLDEFKERPEIAPLIAGGEMVEYSGHLISEAGFAGLIRPFSDGFLVAGDAAGFSLNVGITVRGMEFAIASGVLAAQTVMKAREKKDFSATSLSLYQNLLEDSFVLKDLKTFQHASAFLDNPRLFEHYPQMVGDLLQSLFTVGPDPKQKFSTTIREKVSWSEAWEMLKDLRKGLKI